MVTKVKTAKEIETMREGGKILATVLQTLSQKLKTGMSTKDLSKIAKSEVQSLGAEAAFLGYQGFPDVICISVNEEVVHGIPKANKIIKEGDIVGLDFGVLYRGMITDAAITLIAGRPKQKRHIELVRDTKSAMEKGISVVKDQIRTGDIGFAIETYLKRGKYGIVKDLVGHGVGHMVHEDPNIPNYGRPNTGPWLNKNMTIAIEPMVTLGNDGVRLNSDGWTIVTLDNSYSAHFEHTVLITEEGAEVLTRLSA